MEHLLVEWPCQESLLGHPVHQAQQVEVAFDQHRPPALITAVFGRPLSDLGALVLGNGVKAVLTTFTSSQDIAGVQLAAGAMAVGFSAFTTEQVKGALDHRFGALEAAQAVGQSRISAPKLLAEFGKVGAQLYLLYHRRYRLARENFENIEKSDCWVAGGQIGRALRGFRGPSPTV